MIDFIEALARLCMIAAAIFVVLAIYTSKDEPPTG